MVQAEAMPSTRGLWRFLAIYLCMLGIKGKLAAGSLAIAGELVPQALATLPVVDGEQENSVGAVRAS